MKLVNFKIGMRLGAAFWLILMMTFASSGLSLYKLADIQHNLEVVVKENNVAGAYSHTMNDAIQNANRIMPTLVLMNNEAERQKLQEELASSRQIYDISRDALKDLPSTEEFKSILKRLDAARDAARPVNDQVFDLVLAGRHEEATALLMDKA